MSMRKSLEWALDEIDAIANRVTGFAYPQAMNLLGREEQVSAYAAAVRMRGIKNDHLIVLSPAEIGSQHSRVRWAEGLIEQLPRTHEGRNSWLMNYGVGEEAVALRERRGLSWDGETRSAMR